MQPKNKNMYVGLYVSVWLLFSDNAFQSFGKNIIIHRVNQYIDCRSTACTILSALLK